MFATSRRLPRRLALLAFLLSVPSLLFAWGAWSHQRINRAAILALPPVMRTFFYNHADFLTEEAVLPDARKYVINDKAEFTRHFINPEAYNLGPVAQFPRTWAEAQTRFDAATLEKNGTLPWYIEQMMGKLTRAFKNGRKDEILFLAGDLGHYLGDAHMPLHTTLNHDGQLTDQRGIHSFFEGQLPEMFGKDYNFHVREARYIDDPLAETWAIMQRSFATADTLLRLEKEQQANLTAASIYQLDAQGAIRKNQFGDTYHTADYATRYHLALKHMVERQLRAATVATADYWYTAWVNAGKPDLGKLDSKTTTRNNQRGLKQELKLIRKGKLVDFYTNPEF
ncbi:zinc dependent phospholipase C family protein [Hymenobacter cavernae]|nr:zinc dependent phospholipase C family protein [Hymenobacter cavernae]